MNLKTYKPKVCKPHSRLIGSIDTHALIRYHIKYTETKFPK